NASAGEQWAKLQQAQEIASTRVQPLRVNLPIRGLRFAFTQVLQTEIGKPMMIRLFAENTKMVHWPMRVLQFGFAFIVLWTIVALVSHYTNRGRTNARPL
ncbi:MAG TPA: hypothetical protein VGY98_07110, partial [Verrucomicrobiae bacterium]|nr:hypothetical protein [Verrucomicrobiae bacterium]